MSVVSQSSTWKRFWIPLESQIRLDEDGYLLDPDAPYGDRFNPDVVTYESIADTPCLVLLGEPGIGKTTAMREAWKAEQSSNNARRIWKDLNRYQTDLFLVRDVFENAEVSEWRKGSGFLHLFLDGLDECLLRVDSIAALLAAELARLPTERLRFRIACRSAEWPRLLEDALCKHWGRAGVGVFELTPLREGDVALEAEAKGIPAPVFLDKISQRRAGPLASRPITLKFLLNIFETGIPEKRSELYRQGCLRLCEETNVSYMASRRIGTLSPARKLAIARRIAAVLIFCKRGAVSMEPDLGDVAEADVALQELEGGTEDVSGCSVAVDLKSLHEVIETGLFRRLPGGSRFTFWHQTYAEFLAAEYLVQRCAAMPQMMSLITHPGDPGGRIVPQLSETAAWLAEMHAEVFGRIVRSDPQVLLRSDVGTADHEDKSNLIEALLSLFDAGEITDHEWSLRRAYYKLDHPNLAAQLTPFIENRSRSIAARRFAIDVAEECPNASPLQGLLADIALNESETTAIREQAAYAVMKIGSDETRIRLKPLALSSDEVSTTREMRGTVLRGLWPSLITAKELFANLCQPSDSFFGNYHSFLSSDLVRGLTVDDYPIALQWVKDQPARRELPISFRDLTDDILFGACKYLKNDGIRQAFAGIALARLRSYEPILGDSRPDCRERLSLDDDVERRQILQVILEAMHDSNGDDLRMLRFAGLVVTADLYWLLEDLAGIRDESKMRQCCQLIAELLPYAKVQEMDAALIAAEQIPQLRSALKSQIKSVPLDSDRAREERKAYAEFVATEEEFKARERTMAERRPSQEELFSQIPKLLARCEAGDSDAWWTLTLVLERTSGRGRSSFDADLTRMTGWVEADNHLRARILHAAERYLHECDARPEKWIGKDIVYHPAAAGYRAIVLLHKVCPEVVAAFETEIWKKWAPIVIGYVSESDVQSEELNQAVVHEAYKRVPDEIIGTLLTLIDEENKRGGSLFIIRKVARCWDERLGNALLSKVRMGTLKPSCAGQLLGELIEHQVDGAIEYAESLVTEMSPPDETGRSLSQEAAVAILLSAQGDGWSVVWSAVQHDSAFGRNVFLQVAHSPVNRGTTASFGRTIPESDAAALYIWLAREFPHDEDPRHEGTHGVGPRESIAYFRDSILGDLQSRGTVESQLAIGHIAETLGELDWLKQVLILARHMTLQHTWLPPSPRVLLNLVDRDDRRLVESGEELLAVLIESIDRLNERLQESSLARCLWNESPRKTPKDESALSDFLKEHLNQDLIGRGIVVNREVQIHHGKGEKKAELTDIHVDAFVPGKATDVGRIKAIIELKGQWHRELKTAMKTQLFDRYMTDYDCQYGLYVVGWFDCPAWDDQDKRRRNRWKWDMNEALRFFHKQSKKLSQEGVVIKVAMMNMELR